MNWTESEVNELFRPCFWHVSPVTVTEDGRSGLGQPCHTGPSVAAANATRAVVGRPMSISDCQLAVLPYTELPTVILQNPGEGPHSDGRRLISASPVISPAGNRLAIRSVCRRRDPPIRHRKPAIVLAFFTAAMQMTVCPRRNRRRRRWQSPGAPRGAVFVRWKCRRSQSWWANRLEIQHFIGIQRMKYRQQK